jgi:hypothetical protein
MRVVMAMFVVVIVVVLFFLVLMSCVAMPGAGCELFPWQFLFSGSDHVHFGSADAASVDAGDLQTRIHTQGLHGPGEKLRRNTGIHQGAKEHVAAYAGKAL